MKAFPAFQWETADRVRGSLSTGRQAVGGLVGGGCRSLPAGFAESGLRRKPANHVRSRQSPASPAFRVYIETSSEFRRAKMKFWASVVLFAAFISFPVISPLMCEASVMPGGLVRQIISCAMPQNCDASIVEQLCSSVTNFLDDEAAKTGADLKACKDKCGWKKRKDDLIDGARKKAKESCSKGEAPDVDELSKGLDRNTKDRLKGLYDRNSRMFDGKAKLEAANFGAVSSKDTTITGKGGQVTNLKSSEPDTPKLNSATEFSLAKQSGGPTASAKAAAPAIPQTCDACLQAYPHGQTLPQECNRLCCIARPKEGYCETLCYAYPQGGSDFCNCCRQYGRTCYAKSMGCACGPGYKWNAAGSQCVPSGGGTGFLDKLKAGWKKFTDSVKTVKDTVSDKYHELKGDKKCGEVWYNQDKKCCVNGALFDKCGTECYSPGTKCCQDGQCYDKCEGKCYDLKKECCKEGKKYSDKIKNLNDCPARYQKIAPAPNGCGKEYWGWTVSDNPTGGANTSFREACNTHDRDYGTCKSNAAQSDLDYKTAADTKFLNNMNAVCVNPDNSQAERDACRINVGIYHRMVDPGEITSAYRNGQLKRCKCCPNGAL